MAKKNQARSISNKRFTIEEVMEALHETLDNNGTDNEEIAEIAEDIVTNLGIDARATVGVCLEPYKK